MSKGKWKSTLLGIQGIVGHRSAPDWSFIYETSLTRDPNWYPGDRVVLPDGREFRYAKSLGILSSVEAAQFDSVGVIPYTTAVTAGAVGDTHLHIPASTHAAAFAVDELRGGYLSVFGNNTDDGDHIWRGIVGNTYSAINAAVIVYLDGPLDVAIDTNSSIEVFENPYNHIMKDGAASMSGGNVTHGKAGVPAVYVDAVGKYFWLQTKGPRFLNPAATAINNMLGVYFRHDGSIEGDIAVGSKDNNAQTSQYAGYRISGSYTGNGPMIMLQC
jgi:hypothetical protein